MSTSSPADDVTSGREADLAHYYDQEAPRRAGRAVEAERVRRRDEFVRVLVAEDRSSVFEAGTGPGRDAAAFLAAGLRVAGVDLSAEHVRLAAALGVDAHQASVLHLPFADRSFSAGWTMSTLVHVADADFDAAMSELVRVLEPGSPLAIGLWGGLDSEGPNERDTIKPPRFFSNRSDARLRQMMLPFGDVDRFETWADESVDRWHYQWLLLRTRR